MATGADLDAQAAVVIEALVGSPTRLPADLSSFLGSIAAGATVYALSVTYSGTTPSSSQSYLVATATVTVKHRLSAPADERTYRLGNMLTQQAALIAPSTWRDLASVRSVLQGPEVQAEPDRPNRGDVIEWSVAVQVALLP